MPTLFSPILEYLGIRLVQAMNDSMLSSAGFFFPLVFLWFYVGGFFLFFYTDLDTTSI